jgi:ribosomal protein S18 acetylase RimI-like enzyme
MEKQENQIHLRPAGLEDREFILLMAERFAETGIPAWRDALSARHWHLREAAHIADQIFEEMYVLIAQDDLGQRFGFLAVQPEVDFLTGERQAYIADIAVSQAAEGKGIGKRLAAAAQDWALEEGYRFLTLDVFASNQHARVFYRQLGFIDQTVKMVKILDGPLASQPEALQDRLEHQEKVYWGAFQANNSTLIGSQLSGEVVLIIGGERVGLTEFLSLVQNICMLKCELGPVEVKILAGGTALLTYQLNMQAGVGPQDLSGVYQVNSLWENCGTSWQLVFHQLTPVPQPGDILVDSSL